MKMPSIFNMAVVATLALTVAANAAGGRRAGQGPARAGRGAGDVAGRGDRVRPTPATRPALAAGRGDLVDRREAIQHKRIDAGIQKGQLTPDEVAKLQDQEKNIATLEDSLKSDGKLSRDDIKKLQSALNDASLQIWAQRHDTEGNQKPVSRLGKDIFAQDDLTAKIESGDLTKAQARAFLEDFRKMTTIKRRLGSDNLTDEQRAKLQTEYNDLINKYFVTH